MVPQGGEIFVNLTNVQWPLTAGLALLLVEGPARKRRRRHMIFFAIVTALSGSGAAVLLPVAGWQLWHSRRNARPLDPVAVVILLLGGLQLAILLFSPRLSGATNLNLLRAFVFPVLEAFPELFGTTGTFPADIAFRLVGTAVGVAALLWVCLPARPARSMRRGLLIAALLLLEAGVLAYSAEYGGAPKAFEGGQRYLFVPFVLFVWCLISAWSFSPRTNRWLAVGLGLLLLGIGFQTGRHFTTRQYPAVDWRAVCESLRKGQPAEFEVAPYATKITLSPATRASSTNP
jgi:hypothetical protein